MTSAMALAFAFGTAATASAAELKKIRMDWATYNPVSLILKDQKLLETEFAKDGIAIEWTQSAGSNKALEGLRTNAIDFGSSAGAAALMERVTGTPIKSIYVFSRPEWTALVVPQNSPLKAVSDLKGKKIAVTKGTDPHIFLMRALDGAGLGEKDVTIVAMPHAEGRVALEKGEVDAWSGLDPMMAQSELVAKSRLLFRDPYLNTYGVLNVREDFMSAHDDTIRRVLKAYEAARNTAVRSPDALRAALVKAANIDDAVAARQLERTDLRNSAIGNAQQRTIQAAGEVLQKAGIIAASVNVEKTVKELLDRSFSTSTAA
ncbi:MAG TPA: aliphatic sulfonate ABC transporter substrate-binding protein, partial [Alphaproteobacteria bacterium]|nr:aliphatic sulfonate ABC transporter substrate-binding protein [Alphaproteobacteria bacterium]